MQNYFSIIRLLFKDMFKKMEKKQVLILVLLSLFYIIITVSVISLIYTFSQIFKSAGKEVELITIILFIDFILNIVFGIISALSYLFLSKDVEFFKTLPVKSTSVFMAKLTVIFLSEATISAAILLLSLITAGIFLELPALFFCLIPLFIICVPLFSFGLIGLFSLPLMYIISLFKNKGVASSIAVILASAVGFTLYMRFINLIQFKPIEGEQDYNILLKTATNLSYAIYPIYMLAKFSALKTVFNLPLISGMLTEFFIFLGSLVLMFILSYSLIHHIYNKATAKILESSGSQGYRKRKFISSSLIKTLMKNEWRGVIRNPFVAMQVVSGVIMCPIIVIIFCIMFANMANSIAIEISTIVDIKSIIWVICTMVLMMFGVGTNSGAISCISREGKNINYLKAMPIDPKTIIKAKRNTYLLIQSMSILTGLITMVIVMFIYDSFIWWLPIGAAALTFVWLLAMTNLSIYMDLKKPKLDWHNFKEILKRRKNNFLALIWTFTCIIIGYLLMFLIIFGIISSAYYLILFGYSIFIIIGLVVALILENLLNKKAEVLFNNLNA